MAWEIIKKLGNKEMNDFWATMLVTLLTCIPLITIFYGKLAVIGFIWGALGWYALITTLSKQIKRN